MKAEHIRTSYPATETRFVTAFQWAAAGALLFPTVGSGVILLLSAVTNLRPIEFLLWSPRFLTLLYVIAILIAFVSGAYWPVFAGQSKAREEALFVPRRQSAMLLSGGLIVSGFLIAQSGLAFSSPTFLIGGAFFLLPIGVTALTYRVYADEGAGAAIDFLLTAEEDEESSTSYDDGPERTPPAPESLKNELYFERADRQCEWCGEDVDSPDTHHIKPREEGGPNKAKNLIVLFPNCHRKADRGMISRSKLWHKVSEQMEKQEREVA